MKTIKLKSVEARWVHLATPNEKFGTPGKYEITIVLNAEQAQELKADGANVKENDGVYTLTLRNNSVWAKSGDPMDPPQVVDQALQPVPAEKVKKIGNGSIVNINVVASPYEFAGKKGTSFRTKAVQLVEFKEYEGSDDTPDFDAIAGEF